MFALTRRYALGSLPAASALALQRAPDERAPEWKRIFSGRTTETKLRGQLVPVQGWAFYPPVEDRGGWNRIPEDARQACVAAAEKQVGSPWPPLPATLYLEYQRNGNRSRFEAPYRGRRSRLCELALAECVENRGRFLDEIANGVWALLEESSWVLPAHIGAQRAGVNLPDTAEPVVDLFAADTASLLSWIHRLLGAGLDSVSKLIRPRMERELRARILEPCARRIDFWWMGLDPKLQRSMNNWNPWINSNWLTTVLLMETDERRRAAQVFKVLTSLDRFAGSYHADGGCDEGPGYWGHAAGSMFECLDLLRSATGGTLNYFDIPLVREMGKYIYRVHIGGDWYVNFADATARTSVKGDLIYRFGKAIGDPLMMRHGAFAASLRSNARSSSDSIARRLDGLFNLAELRQADRRPPLIRDAWLPETQHMTARSQEGSTAGLFVAVQGGHNAESHNHNDVGNFVVFAGGKPVLIDVGVETYTAKTFSSKRYEIWTMQSSWHNLPEINGVMQVNGRQAAAANCAYQADGQMAEVSMDLARAWPADARLKSWRRTVRLERARREVTVTDRYELEGLAKSLELNFITSHAPTESAPGVIDLGGLALLLYDASRFTMQAESHETTDARLQPVWGDRVHRIRLRAKSPAAAGNFTTKVVQKGS